MSVIGSNALAGASGQGGGGFVIEKSLRFDSGGSANLKRTPSGQGSRTTFTFSCWAKRSTLAAYPVIFSAGSSSVSSGYFQLSFEIGPMMAYIRHDNGTWAFTTNAQFRDTASWYSIILSVDSSANNASDRLKLYINGVQQTFTSSPTITQDFNFEVNSTIEHHIGAGKSSSGQTSVYYDGYLADVQFIDGLALSASDLGEFNSNGVWVPIKYAGTYGTNGYHLDFADGNDIGNDAEGSNNWSVNNLTATGGTVNYVDSISGSPYIPINAFSTSHISNYVNTSTWAITDTAWMGAWDSSGTSNTFTPTDGIAVSSSLIVYYGNYNNAATTTTLTITYTDSSTETDTFTSGNNNWMGSFTASNASGKTIQSINISANTYQSFGGFVIDGQILTSANPDTDILRDSPTNGDATADTGAGGEVSGNYCTFNPLNELTGGYNFALSDGNLEATNGGDAPGTMAFGSGKKYFELTVKSASSFSQGFYGIVNIADHIRPRAWATSQIAALRDSGSLYGDGSTGSAPAATQVGDVYGFAVDVDNQKLFISVNGTYLNSADPASGTGASFTGRDFSNYAPLASMSAGNSQTIVLNAGQRPFNTAAPSGFKALCTANLPTPDVPDGSTAFDAVLYSGTGNDQSITGLGFSPDLVWTKNRGAQASHAVYDSVRGAGELIRTNESSAEVTVSSRFTSFDSNGFSIGSTSSENNASSNTYVSWAWDAGSSTVSNTDGDVTSSVRANQSAGFSIVKWNPSSNGQSVGHGLNAVPEFIMAKALDNGHSWRVYHKSLSSGKNLLLDSSDAEDTYSADIDTVSSTVFDGGQGLTGTALNNNIAYCFTSVAGYSAFGSYTGNGNTDGPFVYTGFRPALVIVKNKTTSASWCLWDSKRPGYNLTNDLFNLDNSNAEADWAYIDVLSNGFKVKGTHSVQNTNGDNYIYAAFAENPFQANGGLAR